MPLTYTYLEDGTPLVVEELNTRISDAVDGLNNLEQQDIALGAFRTEHLPCMIGRPSLDSQNEANFTATSERSYTNGITAYGTFNIATNLAGTGALSLSYSPGIEISSTSNMNALIILANVQVARFCKDYSGVSPLTDAPLDYQQPINFEDLVSATFVFELAVTAAAGGSYVLPLEKSARTISPGYAYVGLSKNTGTGRTIGNYALSGQGYAYDAWSCKNVAIRTVVVPDDLDDGDLITGIRIKVQTKFCSDDTSTIGLEYNKASLTAIPVQALLGLSS